MTSFDDLIDGEYTMIVDAIEDDLATVFVEHEDEQVGSAVVDVATLPTDARHADAILTAEITDHELSSLNYEADQTQARKQTAQNRFDALSSRPPRDNDGNT